MKIADRVLEAALISKKDVIKWANKVFAKQLKDLEDGTLVWLQDKKADRHGYYRVNKKKNSFDYLGSMPQGLKQKELDDAPIFKE